MRILFIDTIKKNYYLIWRLTERELSIRYRGSFLGWGWSLLQPLTTLAVYTVVFSQILKSRWGGSEGGVLDYAVHLFAGLITFGIFSETANKSPELITRQINYVKKVVFPLEILAIVNVSSVALSSAASLVVLAIFEGLALKHLPWTIIFVPLVWLPLLGITLSCSWILAALGVYVRDVANMISVLTSLLMFLSAVIYPLSALPVKWQAIVGMNPLVSIIEQTRHVAISGHTPSLHYLTVGIIGSVLLCEASYRFFMGLRKGFADVL